MMSREYYNQAIKGVSVFTLLGVGAFALGFVYIAMTPEKNVRRKRRAR